MYEAAEVRRVRKIPVEVQAIFYDGKIDTFQGITAAFPGHTIRQRPSDFDTPGMHVLEIETLEGVMTAQPGDWIIRGVKGEIYPCKPDIFQQTYEFVTLDEAPAPVESWWVEQVLEITRKHRQAKYAHPLVNFIRAAEGLNWYFRAKLRPGTFITPVEAAYMMVVWKLAREMNAHDDDNPIDMMGYIDCHNRIDRYMRQLGYDEGAEAFRTMSEGSMIDLRNRLEELIAAGAYPAEPETEGTIRVGDVEFSAEEWANLPFGVAGLDPLADHYQCPCGCTPRAGIPIESETPLPEQSRESTEEFIERRYFGRGGLSG